MPGQIAATTAEIGKNADLSGEAQALMREEMTPAQFLDTLDQHALFQDAVRFLAHKLAVNTAIRWGHTCVKDLAPPGPDPRSEPAMSATARWLQLPDDSARRQAREAADQGGVDTAAGCLAMAVALSGGSITPPGAPEIVPPPYSANKLVAVSIMVAVLSHTPEKSAERYRRALVIGRKFDAG
jgi:hypothetical protein